MWRPQFSIKSLLVVVFFAALILFMFREFPGPAIFIYTNASVMMVHRGLVEIRCHRQGRKATINDYAGANFWKFNFLGLGLGFVAVIVFATLTRK